MHQKLINYFSKFTTLSTEEQQVLVESMEVQRFAKGDHLIKEGQYNKDSFFILEGLVRQYKLVDGEEISTNFYKEDDWIISLTGFSEHTAAQESFICMEDVLVVTGNEQKAQELFIRHPRFETISRAVMETVFLEQQNRLSSYLTDTPEKRYLELLETKPDIFQRVQQYHIASYIGVKPESLSRIRKRVTGKHA
jgi:CRP-like cAMP-binding protein